MNQEISAKAFTHGNNVFFNQGKFNPSSQSGKHLLAHELAHVVQQTRTIQPYRKKGSFNFGKVDGSGMVEQRRAKVVKVIDFKNSSFPSFPSRGVLKVVFTRFVKEPLIFCL